MLADMLLRLRWSSTVMVLALGTHLTTTMLMTCWQHKATCHDGPGTALAYLGDAQLAVVHVGTFLDAWLLADPCLDVLHPAAM
jgi:hypothetical protein